MKIYVQSKSGNFNAILETSNRMFLGTFFKELRAIGYYEIDKDNATIIVPFEEIEFIREATNDD